jgi:hypothetical protein
MDNITLIQIDTDNININIELDPKFIENNLGIIEIKL